MIIDVLVLASFYVIRVWAGAIAINVEVTAWLIIAAMLLALFLGFGKRRHELTQFGEDASSHRSILKEYSPYYLDQMIAVVTSSTIIVYIFYTFDETVKVNMGTELLPITIPFVLYGIFRYLYLIHQKELGGSPTQTIITDAPLLIDVGLWVILALYLIS
ncbi:MAG: hypothetical protein Q8P72_02795 [Candidatus Roizmanbacteria bacterium]|nr:hypothetical protein [Candidatus Roizmanbacteria bacterium]